VTIRLRAPFSARHLARALVDARAIEIANAAHSGLRAVARRPTRGAAHPLRPHR